MAALDAVRMGTMSINQVTSEYFFESAVSIVRQPTGWRGGQTKPQLKTSGNSRGFL